MAFNPAHIVAEANGEIPTKELIGRINDVITHVYYLDGKLKELQAGILTNHIATKESDVKPTKVVVINEPEAVSEPKKAKAKTVKDTRFKQEKKPKNTAEHLMQQVLNGDKTIIDKFTVDVSNDDWQTILKAKYNALKKPAQKEYIERFNLAYPKATGKSKDTTVETKEVVKIIESSDDDE